MSATASLRTGERTLELPVVVGTEAEHAIDISSLRSQTGLHHARRGLRQYRVVPERHHLYGEEGILRYRGIPIEVLAEKSNFVESACLLIWGCLPTQEQLETFSSQTTSTTAAPLRSAWRAAAPTSSHRWRRGSAALHGARQRRRGTDAREDRRVEYLRKGLRRPGEGQEQQHSPSFGHRVYKNFDPRVRIIKKECEAVLSVAEELEAAALEDDYFVERKLYPNVDFYSGVILRALGIPTSMFTVICHRPHARLDRSLVRSSLPYQRPDQSPSPGVRRSHRTRLHTH